MNHSVPIARSQGSCPWPEYHLHPCPYPLVNVNITNYGKSSFLMGKNTISMAIFNSYVSLPEVHPASLKKIQSSPVWWWTQKTLLFSCSQWAGKPRKVSPPRHPSKVYPEAKHGTAAWKCKVKQPFRPWPTPITVAPRIPSPIPSVLSVLSRTFPVEIGGQPSTPVHKNRVRVTWKIQQQRTFGDTKA